MPSFSHEIIFEVYCEVCGSGLCGESKGHDGDPPFVNTKPCPDCMKQAREGGYSEGHEEGFDEGREESSDEIERLRKEIETLTEQVEHWKQKFENKVYAND